MPDFFPRLLLSCAAKLGGFMAAQRDGRSAGQLLPRPTHRKNIMRERDHGARKVTSIRVRLRWVAHGRSFRNSVLRPGAAAFGSKDNAVYRVAEY
jgi:hypothetical protein